MLAVTASFGCGALDDGLPTGAPTKVEMVADQGFQNAGAVAASPDGKTFYVAAYDDEQQPGVFAVAAADGKVTPLHVGAPLSYPTDLATSCDGDTIYVGDLLLASSADAIVGDFDTAGTLGAPIHRLSLDGDIKPLEAQGIGRAAGLVIDTECEVLYVAGFDEEDQPAVFTLPLEGGAATVLYSGAPLVSPTGIHVDANRIAWVMDHSAANEQGEGMLFSIDEDGTIAAVASGLAMGRHGGVSLAPGGVTAVIPVGDEIAGSRLLTANTKTGQMGEMATPEIERPTGVAAAREAPVMVVAGESSIHIATFE
jgi:sugar lactone lactonase YvrE